MATGSMARLTVNLAAVPEIDERLASRAQDRRSSGVDNPELLLLTTPAAQASAARILDRAGCVVIPAADGARAIDLAERPVPSP